MSAAAKIIDRLSRVKSTGPDRWIASCPTGAHAHGDRSRGLSIRQVDDRVLLYCHGGCGAVDVVEALGLKLSDLYDAPLGERPAVHSTIPARDLLGILDHELLVAILILNDITQRRAVTEAQVGRLVQAAARVGKARDAVNPMKVSRHAA